jgi:hypothetical protein
MVTMAVAMVLAAVLLAIFCCHPTGRDCNRAGKGRHAHIGVAAFGFPAMPAQTSSRAISHNSYLSPSSSPSLGANSLPAVGSPDILESQSLVEGLVVASSLSYLSMGGNDRDDDCGDPSSPSPPPPPSSSSPMSRSPYYGKSGLTPLLQVADPATESGATVFRWSGGGGDAAGTMIVVACRGSATPVNFFTNLKFELVPADPQRMMMTTAAAIVPNDGGGGGGNATPDPPLLIHKGFQEAAVGLWDALRPRLYRVLEEELCGGGESVRLVFTGHSLGAATATLCGYQYTLERRMRGSGGAGGEKSSTPSPSSASSTPFPPLSAIITFGGPRLVNVAMARYMRNVLMSDGVDGDRRPAAGGMGAPPRCCNLIHSYDPILQQNQPLWDALQFEAVGEERVCEPYRPTIYQTGQLRQDVLAWNLLDHCWYLGIFVGPRIVGN